jgi:hypothetical protein
MGNPCHVRAQFRCCICDAPAGFAAAIGSFLASKLIVSKNTIIPSICLMLGIFSNLVSCPYFASFNYIIGVASSGVLIESSPILSHRSFHVWWWMTFRLMIKYFGVRVIDRWFRSIDVLIVG